jgi:transcriptional regulator with XRE-family HTH domain
MDIAELLGASSGWIAQVEQGKIGLPKPERLFTLAEALQTDTADLLHYAGYLAIPSVIDGVDMRLIAAARNAPKQLQDIAVSVLRSGDEGIA